MSDTSPATPRAGGRIVIGLGNVYRGDDGVGPAVASAVEATLSAGSGERSEEPMADVVVLDGIADPLDLLGRWDGAATAIVIDAARSGAPPGTVTVIDAHRDTARGRFPRVPGTVHPPTSTHGVGLHSAIALARSLGTAPDHIAIVVVEGEIFDHRDRLSPSVASAVGEAAASVIRLLEVTAADPSPSDP